MQLGSLGDEETKQHVMMSMYNYIYIISWTLYTSAVFTAPTVAVSMETVSCRPPQWEQIEKTGDFMRVFVWAECMGSLRGYSLSKSLYSVIKNVLQCKN